MLASPRLLSIAAAALAGAAVAFLAVPALVQGKAEAQPRAVTPRGPLAADELANIDLFKKSSPSVVHITSLGVQRDMFSMNVQQVPRGTGTGFVWDADGHIVTNFHVIQGANAARVTLADQSTYDARLVGQFADRDLAVLRIEARGRRAARARVQQAWLLCDEETGMVKRLEIEGDRRVQGPRGMGQGRMTLEYRGEVPNDEIDFRRPW